MRLEIKLNVNTATASIFKYVFLNYVKIFKCEKRSTYINKFVSQRLFNQQTSNCYENTEKYSFYY